MIQKHLYLVFIAILVVMAGCQKPKKKFSVSQYDPTSDKFAFLKEPLKDVRILALGESSHGFGSMHSLKANLVEYLHKEMGYDVLVMEASYGDVGLAGYNIADSNPKQLINTTVADNLRSTQMLPLFDYIKQQNETERPLAYRGMDAKISGLAFRFRLMHVIRRLEPKIIQDSIENGLFNYNRSFNYLDDEVQWQHHMDKYKSTIDFAQSIIEESREDIQELEIVEAREVEILERYLSILEQAVDYKFGETYTRGLALRDSLMAENVIYFAEKEFPKAKIIIWGHNGHIEKSPGEGDNIKWLGHYLKERYGDKYYALGMYAKKGFIYQTAARKTSNFDINQPSFIEAKMQSDYGDNVYLDVPAYDAENTSWTNQLISGYELEAGGKVDFIPSKRFDGLLLLGQTVAPEYLINVDAPQRGSEGQ